MKNMERSFLITIDTEEDNQWDNSHESTTTNARFLPRFQSLCEKYSFKPTYLTTYHMARDPFFREFGKEKQKDGLCEIGMHLHAWDMPPVYRFPNDTGNRAYLIEYPESVMDEKIRILDETLTESFEKKPVSHRAGRWATNQSYFKLLEKYGYLCDCSVTPGVDWSSCPGATGIPGSDYRRAPDRAYLVSEKLLEIPMTIRKLRFFEKQGASSFKGLMRESYHATLGKRVWLRPSIATLQQMNQLVRQNENDYAMFMLHSSEFMPGGSPSFPTEKSIEDLYLVVEQLFMELQNLGYTGMTLEEYKRRRKK